MKTKVLFVLTMLFLLPLSMSSGSPNKHRSTEASQSTKKPKYDYDYMSSILSRNTKPLGLKENVLLKKLLNQPSITWAIRAGGRHILN